jgi:acetyl-CoA carboxylase biotin carboxyl carrier protein
MSEDEQTKAGRTGAKQRKPNIDASFVRELAALLDETGLTEIEVEEEGTRVRVARQGTPYLAAPAMGLAPGAAATPQAKEAASEPKRGTTITSPMVGTAYMGASPGAPPFVKVGDSVKEGQTLIIIEAMKTMNQVASQATGRIIEIYVQDGQPVEYGEPLMLID